MFLLCGLTSSKWAMAALPVEQGVALDIRWMGTDLVDEFVHDLELNPPFPTKTLVALTEIDAPVGLDERFEVVTENHLIDLLLSLSKTHIQLAHCGACRKFVVKSTKAGTYMGRGSDQPEVLKDLAAGAGAHFGLSLNFEAATNALILNAQIFSLTESGQPIVWARKYTTSMHSRLALQSDSNLMTLAEAQQAQRNIINRRDPLEWVSRVTMSLFTAGPGMGGQSSVNAPLLFAEQSIEGILLPRMNRRMAFTVGATSIEKSMSGYMVGGHFSQLLLRNTPSLIIPDLYGFFGFHFYRLRGPAAAPFGAKQFDLYSILKSSTEPKASFVMYRLGVELHAKHRLGALVFIENSPQFNDSDAIATSRVIGIPYHAFGMGVMIKW
jgi:hypothetical protein